MPIVSNRISSSRKNIDKTKRNGAQEESRTVIKYITNMGKDGVSGEDAFSCNISPQSHIFNAGPTSQTDEIFVYAHRGSYELSTFIDSSAITGQIPGILDCSIRYNGTNRTSVVVTASNALASQGEDNGTIMIPVRYPIDTYDSSENYDASMWDSSLHTFVDCSTFYSWSVLKSTTSAWILDLTNENASINADANGNIYATAIRPTCTANLYYGTEDVSTALYYINTPAVQNVQGLSCNASTGVITFNDGSANTPFTFSGTSLEITVQAKVNNETKATKIMSVSKSIAGKDGDGSPAVSYWLDFSADAVKVDSSGTPHPSTVTATAYKQLGGDAPQTATECWLKWGYNTTDPSTKVNNYTYTTDTIDASKDYITFKLFKDTSTYLGESETIPILHDGKDGAPGSPGATGPAGPVIRGPILWESSLPTRRFCSGDGTGTDSSYIDIVYYDPSGGVDYHYYRCITSYTHTQGDSWPGNNKWQRADNEYDFIATQLLLAQGAKIKFLTNNEFYLTDADGNIHGGGRASNTDSSVIFWAGSSNGSTNINAAPFRVTYDGDIYANSGVFAGYVQMPYTFISDLWPDDYLKYSSTYKYVSQTTWKGPLSSAPANPSSGWCYYNTSSNYYYYYYSGAWRQMTEQNDTRGYVADNRAYLIADGYSGSYGMGDGGMLVIPEPSSSLNGFTYHILCEPNVATRGSGENPAISIMTVNQTESFKVYAYSTSMEGAKRLSFYGGHVEMTCVPQHYNNSVTYKWVVTMCTGGVDIYSGTGSANHIGSYSSLCGYSANSNYYCVTKIQADPSTDMPTNSNKKRDTIYVSRGY